MITLRRADERHHDRRRKQDVWHTFVPDDQTGVLARGFGSLERLDEERLPPGAGASDHPRHDAEIITYVREGTLADEDSLGHAGVIRAGEFQSRTAGGGVRHTGANASRSEWAHVFQIWLRPAQTGLAPNHAQKRFSAAQRRGVLCIVASPDARKGSLRLAQDVLVCSSLLDPGQHVVHELSPGRSAWLHLVGGEVTLGDVVLSAGDGAGFSAERAVSITARKESELLLLELGEYPERAVRSSTE